VEVAFAGGGAAQRLQHRQCGPSPSTPSLPPFPSGPWASASLLAPSPRLPCPIPNQHTHTHAQTHMHARGHARTPTHTHTTHTTHEHRDTHTEHTGTRAHRHTQTDTDTQGDSHPDTGTLSPFLSSPLLSPLFPRRGVDVLLLCILIQHDAELVRAWHAVAAPLAAATLQLLAHSWSGWVQAQHMQHGSPALPLLRTRRGTARRIDRHAAAAALVEQREVRGHRGTTMKLQRALLPTAVNRRVRGNYVLAHVQLLQQFRGEVAWSLAWDPGLHGGRDLLVGVAYACTQGAATYLPLQVLRRVDLHAAPSDSLLHHISTGKRLDRRHSFAQLVALNHAAASDSMSQPRGRCSAARPAEVQFKVAVSRASAASE